MEFDTSLEFEPLLLDEMFVIGPPDANLKGKSASWSQIAALPLILTSAPNSVHLLVEAAAAKGNERLNVIAEVNYVPVLIDLILAGAGYTLLPYSAVHELLAKREVTVLRINELAYTWVTATQKHKPLSTRAVMRETFWFSSPPGASIRRNGRMRGSRTGQSGRFTTSDAPV